MDKVCTAAMMRELDRQAIEGHGIPGVVLMENAGRGAFEMIMELFSPLSRVSVFCGKGNNGGDGYVIARHLLNAGVEAEVFLLAPREEIRGDARINLDVLEMMDAKLFEVLSLDELLRHTARLIESSLIVDAILGTGLQSEVTGFYREVIEFINDLTREGEPIPILAVDIPSGLNADTGQIMGAAIEAHATATFGAAKVGQLCYPGASLVGDLQVVEISIPSYLFDSIPYHAVTEEGAADLLMERSEDAHKGHNGHLLVLAGSPGKTGAAAMAAETALRAGAGLVTLGVPASLQDILEAKVTEVMTEPLPERPDHTLGWISIERAVDLLEGRSALAVGPGLGQGEEVLAFMRRIIGAFEGPLVIDADGLNAVAKNIAMLEDRKGPLILTPHPGEMARLCGKTVKEIQADRLNTALDFAREHGVILVLKGAHTITATPDGKAYINLSGNPGMASAGMGDVLTGAIAGLLSQGYEPRWAAVLGVYLHGMAGDMAAAEMGEVGIMATDLINSLPMAIKRLGEFL